MQANVLEVNKRTEAVWVVRWISLSDAKRRNLFQSQQRIDCCDCTDFNGCKWLGFKIRRYTVYGERGCYSYEYEHGDLEGCYFLSDIGKHLAWDERPWAKYQAINEGYEYLAKEIGVD